MWNGVKARFVRVAALVGLLVAGIVGMGAFFGCGTLIAVYSCAAKAGARRSSPRMGKPRTSFFGTPCTAAVTTTSGTCSTALTAAYLKNPGDAETAAHIGFAHIWRVGAGCASPIHRRRSPMILCSRKYFSEAVRLAPDDARFRGFLASAELGEAQVHGDERLTRARVIST